MSEQKLFRNLVKLASENPEVRKHLLPILKEHGKTARRKPLWEKILNNEKNEKIRRKLPSLYDPEYVMLAMAALEEVLSVSVLEEVAQLLLKRGAFDSDYFYDLLHGE